MYAIRKDGKYLCCFMFRDGFDYREREEVSYFAYFVGSETITDKLRDLAKKEEGKIVQVGWLRPVDQTIKKGVPT